MGGSILEIERHSSSRITERLSAAWRAVGSIGQVLTVVAAVCCAIVAVAGDRPASVAAGASLAVLVAAALVDAAERRLPNVLVLAAACPVVLTLVVAGDADLARSAGLGALVVGAPLLVTHLATPTGMGFGDVKAGFVLGAATGLLGVEVAVLTLVLGLGLGAASGLALRARSVALGPALVAGALAAVLIA